MKILLATSRVTHVGGGIASYNRELVDCLGNNHEFYLLSDAEEKDIKGFKSTFSTYGHSNQDHIYAKKLVDRINLSEYDCIINSYSSFLPIIAPFVSAPIISVSHFVNGRLAINAGFNAEYISAIISLSNYGKEFLERTFKIANPDKVKVIYNFVKDDTSYLNEKKIDRQPLTIVYPGGTSIQKSVDVIQALVYKLLRTNLNFRFYWLGSTTLPSAKLSLFGLKTTSSLFKNDSRLIITDRVPREESMKIIGDSNIFLLPSRGEGCPMTLLEAMRGGCIPIVSDAHHGSREILEDAGIGCIVKQGSANELFDAIKNIIVNHDTYKSDYKKSIAYLQENLSQDKWSDKMLRLIESVQNADKLHIPFDVGRFRCSARKYRIMLGIDRLKTILNSAKYRVIFDWKYLLDKVK